MCTTLHLFPPSHIIPHHFYPSRGFLSPHYSTQQQHTWVMSPLELLLTFPCCWPGSNDANPSRESTPVLFASPSAWAQAGSPGMALPLSVGYVLHSEQAGSDRCWNSEFRIQEIAEYKKFSKYWVCESKPGKEHRVWTEALEKISKLRC